MASEDETQGGILDTLQSTDRGVTVVRVDDRSCIVDDGANETLICPAEALLVFPKGGIRKRSENFQTGTGLASDVGRMSAEGEVRVQNHAQERGILYRIDRQTRRPTLERGGELSVVLSRPRGEQGERGFLGRHRHSIGVSPGSILHSVRFEFMVLIVSAGVSPRTVVAECESSAKLLLISTADKSMSRVKKL